MSKMAEQIVAMMAWVKSGDMRDGCNIGVVASEIAKEIGIDDESAQVQEAIIDGLRDMSGREHYDMTQPNNSTNEFGHCEIADVDCYWINNGGTSEWSQDKPDAWDEMLEQYEAAAKA